MNAEVTGGLVNTSITISRDDGLSRAVLRDEGGSVEAVVWFHVWSQRPA